jgi:hypothetical protein
MTSRSALLPDPERRQLQPSSRSDTDGGGAVTQAQLRPWWVRKGTALTISGGLSEQDKVRSDAATEVGTQHIDLNVSVSTDFLRFYPI